MRTFHELVRVHIAEMTHDCVRDVTGWGPSRVVAAKQGHLDPCDLSFAEVVRMADGLGLDVADLAASVGG